MAAGAATITSQTTSLPEVGGDAALYIDPLEEASITTALQRVEDSQYRNSLIERGQHQSQRFSWEITAKTVHQAYEAALDLPKRLHLS